MLKSSPILSISMLFPLKMETGAFFQSWNLPKDSSFQIIPQGDSDVTAAISYNILHIIYLSLEIGDPNNPLIIFSDNLFPSTFPLCTLVLGLRASLRKYSED